MKKLILTGSTGFIGSALLKELKKESIEIICLGKRRGEIDNTANCVYFDKYEEIPEIISKLSPDIIIHCAALYSLNDTPALNCELIDSNIKLSTLLASSAKQNCIDEFLYIGTIWQDYIEERGFESQSIYTVSKKLAWNSINWICGNEKTKVIGVKLSDTFGINDQRKKILDLLVDSAIKKEMLEMTPGYQEVRLTSVTAICKAISDVVMNRVYVPAGDYTMPGKVLTIRDLSKILEEKLEVKELYKFGTLDYREGTRLKLPDTEKLLPLLSEIDFERDLCQYIESKLGL